MKALFPFLLCIAINFSSLYAFSFSNGTTAGSAGFTNLQWKLESNRYFDDSINPMTRHEPLDTIDAGSFGTFYLIITDLDTSDSLKRFTYTLAHVASSDQREYKCTTQSWYDESIPDSSLALLPVQLTPGSWADTLNEELHFFPILQIANISKQSWSNEYIAVSGQRCYFIRNSSNQWLKFRFSYGDYGSSTKARQLLSRFEYRVSEENSDTFDMMSVVLGDTIMLQQDPRDSFPYAVVHANNSEGKSILLVKSSKYSVDGYSIENDSGSFMTRAADHWSVKYNRDTRTYRFTYLGPTDTDVSYLDSLVSDFYELRLQSGYLEYDNMSGDTLKGRWHLEIPVSGAQEIDDNALVVATIGDTLNFLWGSDYISSVILQDLFVGTDYNNKECHYSSAKVLFDQPVSIIQDVTKQKYTLHNSAPVRFSLFNLRGQEVATFTEMPKDIHSRVNALPLSQGFYILKMVSSEQVQSIPLLIK